jgi:hypothetical protein
MLLSLVAFLVVKSMFGPKLYNVYLQMEFLIIVILLVKALLRIYIIMIKFSSYYL